MDLTFSVGLFLLLERALLSENLCFDYWLYFAALQIVQ